MITNTDTKQTEMNIPQEGNQGNNTIAPLGNNTNVSNMSIPNQSNININHPANQGAIRGVSALYGETIMPEQQMLNVQSLRDPQLLNTLKYAMGVYQDELANNDYTPLTINSYSSAINRFVDFLEIGYVVPDYDNKPRHQSQNQAKSMIQQ